MNICGVIIFRKCYAVLCVFVCHNLHIHRLVNSVWEGCFSLMYFLISFHTPSTVPSPISPLIPSYLASNPSHIFLGSSLNISVCYLPDKETNKINNKNKNKEYLFRRSHTSLIIPFVAFNIPTKQLKNERINLYSQF